MTAERHPNSGLAEECARCHRRFPRMYRENGQIVCKPEVCRPGAPTFPNHQESK